MQIVITGKGGVGKTMISALTVKAIFELKSKNENILAVDADPASNFSSALGIIPKGSVGDIREEMRKMMDNNAFAPTIDKEMYFDGKIFEITTEYHSPFISFDFIEMGRPEGYECYCALNDMLRKILRRVTDAYKYVIVDCEAGLEHISRQTTTKADIFIIVTDTSLGGFDTAVKISSIAQKFGIKKEKIFLVVNKFNENLKDEIESRIKNCGIPEICRIPYEKEIAKFNLEGRPLIEISNNSRTYNLIKSMWKNLIFK